MDDKTDIRLMNPHSKGHRCHHKMAFPMDKFMLGICSFLI